MKILAEKGWKCSICGGFFRAIQHHIETEHHIHKLEQIREDSYILDAREMLKAVQDSKNKE